MKKVVVVADNPLIVAAIRSGIRGRGTFELLGYIDPRNATAANIRSAGADVVLVDEAEQSEEAIALIRNIKDQDQAIMVMVLTVRMDSEWLARAFEVGATGAISKAVQPSALATLLRESLCGHIVHPPKGIGAASTANASTSKMLAEEHSSLTERELEILQLVSSGATNGEIARQLWITQQTVKFHVSNIYRKLEVANRTEACHYAHVNGLVASREPVPAAAAREPVAVAVSEPVSVPASRDSLRLPESRFRREPEPVLA